MSTNLTALALILSLAPAIGYALEASVASTEAPATGEEFPMTQESLAIIQQFDQDYDKWAPTNASKTTGHGDEVKVIIHKGSQNMVVSVNGEVRFSTMVTTGMSGHTTPSVTTHAQGIERVHFSKEYHAPLPWAIRITGGYFIHGASDGALPWMRKKIPHSHGCVRVPPVYARQLYDIVQTAGIHNTSITVMN